jgi:hypothetical protein
LPAFKESQQFQILKEDVSTMKQAKPQFNQSNSFTELVKFKIDRQLEIIEDDMANTDFEKVIHDSLGRQYLKLFGRELFQVGSCTV